ncbi:hypothetical protein K353_02432 [Kitasatospora sp. SolWspMP-SS2h]|uniref:hypothetical protein n=1 Tax=Kitasatospora sp. SolWspMP-SS2h TaxID=1305729 RepID=UPI000DBA6C74|nr:hypothetical protein [Kitasatospora sp. SolWspMP-SS2h]RAJ42756.1 hypothetical protein K353_02432 [Kitasatospora sp. SolWspMP-SS2h]
MNLRALTRGDAAVAGAAVLLLISSFLKYRGVDCDGGIYCAKSQFNAWDASFFPALQSVFLLGVIGAVLILLFRFQKATLGNKEIIGLRLDQWGTAAIVIALWGILWSLIGGPDGLKNGAGSWLALIALLVMAGAVIAAPALPALQAPLAGPAAPGAAQQQQFPPYGAQQQGAPGAYGYPGAQQQPFPGQPQSEQGGAGQQQQPFGQGQQQPAPGGYGYPQAAAQQQAPAPSAAAQAVAPLPTAVQPAVQDHVPAQAAAPFAPFWFAVPAVRQLGNKDNPAAPPVGELVPGTWYLAVDQRGAALVAQLPDGTHGVLNDTSGIQRG